MSKGSPRREGAVAAESVWVVLDLQAQGLACGVSGSGELLKGFGPGQVEAEASGERLHSGSQGMRAGSR